MIDKNLITVGTANNIHWIKESAIYSNKVPKTKKTVVIGKFFDTYCIQIMITNRNIDLIYI